MSVSVLCVSVTNRLLATVFATKLRRDDLDGQMTAARLDAGSLDHRRSGMNARKHSLPLLVSAVFLAALALAVPTRAMEACNDSDCTYYGPNFSGEGHCGPFDTHCHCFLNGEGELNQHQAACNAIVQ